MNFIKEIKGLWLDYIWVLYLIGRKFRWSRIKSGLKRAFQRRARGWDDSDTWALDKTIARFVLPRLVRFKETQDGFPPDMTEEEWDEKLDYMIWTMDQIANDREWEAGMVGDKEYYLKVQEGCLVFGRHFRQLWW